MVNSSLLCCTTKIPSRILTMYFSMASRVQQMDDLIFGLVLTFSMSSFVKRKRDSTDTGQDKYVVGGTDKNINMDDDVYNDVLFGKKHVMSLMYLHHSSSHPSDLCFFSRCEPMCCVQLGHNKAPDNRHRIITQ
jgi:hypothetical protein